MELYKKLNISDFLYQKIVEKLKRKPNDFETYLFSAMHSEHCGYMHSKKYLNGFYSDDNFQNENSGCIKINNHGIFFKMESHNHPCVIEPYQGSMTGIGGIVRDVLALGARPCALLNSLKFGLLKENKTKYYLEEVTRGISDYGNSIGVPTVGGETIFDKRFNNIPIVNVFAMGYCELSKIKLSKAKENGIILLLGSKTGTDGLNGANFASSALSDDSQRASRQSVQIGDPYTKKKLIEAVLEINKLKEVIACQDLGASGILSSTCEMGYKGGCSIELYLDKVHTQNPDITPSEIMLSESQERMAFVVEEQVVDKIKKIAEKYELDCSAIGKTLKGGSYRVYYGDELLCDLGLDVLCEPYLFDLKKNMRIGGEKKNDNFNLKEQFENLLDDDNFSSKKYIYSQFDQEVQGATVFSQKENSIGIIYLKEINSFIALCAKTVLGISPKEDVCNSFMYLYRKLVSCGFEPKGLTNCLNFASPEDLDVQGDFLDAIDELKKLSFRYKIPVVSGNVSFYNEKGEEKIPPCVTLVFVGSMSSDEKIIKSKINTGDKIFYIPNNDKEVIFELFKKGLIKNTLPIGEFGLFGTLLKEALFYNLGLEIKVPKEQYFKKYLKGYILITDKKDELEKFGAFCCGRFIDDKIIFDDFIYDKDEIYQLYHNRIEKEIE